MGCSHQALIISQEWALKDIKKIEYDFSIVKTEEEAISILMKIHYRKNELHKVREFIEVSYLSKEELAQLNYEELYNGLEQLTRLYSKDIKLLSKSLSLDRDGALSNYYRTNTQFKNALSVANDGLYFAKLNLKREGNHRTVVRAYSNLSTLYRGEKQYREALKYINISIALAKKSLEKNSLTLADSYYKKSIISFAMKNYKNSISYLYKSIKIVEALDINKQINLMVYYSQLSKNYRAINQNYKAKLSLEKVSKIINSEISREYTKEEKLVLASEVDRDIKHIFKMQKENREQDSLDAYNRIYKYTLLFIKKGDFLKALKLAESSLFFAKKIANQKESSLTVKSYNSLSLIYLKRENYSKALEYC
jgi:tetratricopeptide (TPR) repeat protein